MTQHQSYLAKKNVAKLLMAEKGIKFQEAFDSIPDKAITSPDHNAIFQTLIGNAPVQTPKKEAKKKK